VASSSRSGTAAPLAAFFVRQRTDRLQDNSYNPAMCDAYVYYFMRSSELAGRRILSKRRATLEAIKGKGEAVMESQIVVDETEIDGNGFLLGGASDGAHPMDQLWAQIRSLERRAKSRDTEALMLCETTDGARTYMLSLESRELRDQVQKLKKQRADLLIEQLDDRRQKKYPREPIAP
jgi:hypothetical protein